MTDNVEQKYSVMVPYQEDRKATRCVYDTVTDNVEQKYRRHGSLPGKADRHADHLGDRAGAAEPHDLRRSRALGLRDASPIRTIPVATRLCQRWQPNIEQQEIPYTVCRPVAREVEYTVHGQSLPARAADVHHPGLPAGPPPGGVHVHGESVPARGTNADDPGLPAWFPARRSTRTP